MGMTIQDARGKRQEARGIIKSRENLCNLVVTKKCRECYNEKV